MTMMTLIAAAAVAAAQPAPAPQAQMPAMQHDQHAAMKEDCCKDCCKDMADKHAGHKAEAGKHGQHAAE